MSGAYDGIRNPWGNNDECTYNWIDTPGMSDSSGNDIQFLRDMIA